MSMKELEALEWPYDCESLLRRRKHFRKQLLARESVSYIKKRIALLGGSTTADIRDMLELFCFFLA